MAEKKLEEMVKEVAYGYTVTRNTDGSVDVKPVDESIKQEEIFDDIERVAEVVKENKTQQLVYKAAYYGTLQALSDWSRKAAEARAAEEKPEVEE